MSTRTRHRILPVFLPRRGCPSQCVFCSPQATIGSPPPLEEQFRKVLESASDGCEIAFYGGSFTHIPAVEQDELLDRLAPLLQNGAASSIRISARPDGEDRFEFLAEKGVGCVEFGVESMTDRVLKASGRGHDSACVEKSVKSAKKAGLKVGVHLMIGLPQETGRDRLETVERIVALKPDFVRLSPTLVLHGSPLEGLYFSGEYKPLEFDAAVSILAGMLRGFESAKIAVARIGLHPNPELLQELIAGPWHPRLGELVRQKALHLATTMAA